MKIWIIKEMSEIFHILVIISIFSFPCLAEQPDTGEIVSGSAFSGGYGEISIYNTEDENDAVFIVASEGSTIPRYAVYINKGDGYSVDNISDGTYEGFFQKGRKWDQINKKFLENCEEYKIKNPLTFTQKKEEKDDYIEIISENYIIHLGEDESINTNYENNKGPIFFFGNNTTMQNGTENLNKIKILPIDEPYDNISYLKVNLKSIELLGNQSIIATEIPNII